MMRWVMFTIIFLWTLAVPALGEGLPRVLQPSAYSASEVTTSVQVIGPRTENLDVFDMTSRRYFTASDWSNCDFSMYTAEVLSERHYETVLVSGGWLDSLYLCNTREGSAFQEKVIRYTWYINNGLQASYM